MAKNEKGDTTYGQDLIELFRGAGDEEDEQATVILLSKLRGCENVEQQIQARNAVENAEQIEEQFLKDFARLEGAWRLPKPNLCLGAWRWAPSRR
jgi:hypothetical protein